MVGCELDEFRRYYRDANLPWGDLGEAEESHVMTDPSHLITWRKNNQIIGHAIWHESNTEEHTSGGNPRNSDDRRILQALLGPGTDFVELHEVWLLREHRGKGYGKEFFEFFEDFISRRGHRKIVYTMLTTLPP